MWNLIDIFRNTQQWHSGIRCSRESGVTVLVCMTAGCAIYLTSTAFPVGKDRLLFLIRMRSAFLQYCTYTAVLYFRRPRFLPRSFSEAVLSQTVVWPNFRYCFGTCQGEGRRSFKRTRDSWSLSEILTRSFPNTKWCPLYCQVWLTVFGLVGQVKEKCIVVGLLHSVTFTKVQVEYRYSTTHC